MSISKRDQQHIWHPLNQHKTNPEMLAITKARGVELTDEAGKTYIDGMASWYTSMFGHCNPVIVKAVQQQMEQLDQVIFSGLTHEPAVELSEELMSILPENQQKVFYNDNGSTATEIGIKMALQFHHNQGNDRKVMLSFENGFHGDTFGAMSVSSLSVYNGAFEDHFIEVQRIPTPDGKNTEAILQQIKKLHEEHGLAGFIYEPLVQGAAAMLMYDQKGLNAILDFCKKRDIVLVADEVMTGFGKTGSHFASDFVETQPDVICLSKALTAGLLPMGATTCTQQIFDAFYDDNIKKGLFHGHTYTANPPACAAAIAGIRLLKSSEIQENIKRIEQAHRAFDYKIKSHPKVARTRQTGVIYALDLAIEMKRYGSLRDEMYAFLMNEGIYLRPLGKTLYILPAFTIKPGELDLIYQAIVKLLNHLNS